MGAFSALVRLMSEVRTSTDSSESSAPMTEMAGFSCSCEGRIAPLLASGTFSCPTAVLYYSMSHTTIVATSTESHLDQSHEGPKYFKLSFRLPLAMRISCVLGRNICNLTTAMPVVASEGNMDIVSDLVDIEANTCDRFNGTPLEGAVRHNFDMPQVPHVQRDNGATLAGTYAAAGRMQHI